jgi:hypothetical protein
MAARKAVGALTRSACSPPKKVPAFVGEGGSVCPVTKSAFSTQSTDMEWHLNQPQQDDRRGDLNYPSQLSQHYLQPCAPRLGNLISERLDRMGH